MTAARRTNVEVTWQHKDISRYIEPYLLACTYVDNLTSAADDLTLELEDREGLWEGDWRPTFGDSVVARVTASEPGWFSGLKTLQLGTFAHDKIALKGPPRIVSLQCVSAPLATGLRRRKKTRAWRGRTLQGIAQDIADDAKLKLDWSGPAGNAYAARVQSDKSDLEFLDELCKEVGRCCKVTELSIVIFDELSRDSTASSGPIDLRGSDHAGGGHVLSWTFDGDDSDRYGSCHITFMDPRTGKLSKGEFVDPANPNGQTLELRLPLEAVRKGKVGAEDARKKAMAMLRNANRFATRGQLVVVGDPGLVAGVTFDLAGGFGIDGKFIVAKAAHHPVGGYTCALDVRRCIEGY